MHVTARLKRCVMNEESSMLWHWRLGHISIERIKKLGNDGVLSTLDFADFETCVNCIKGKQTNKSNQQVNPQEKKLDPRTISGYFLRYAERSKGYIFYLTTLGLWNQEM